MRDFTRMNPSEFHGSKVDEDPQAFIDEVSRVVTIMGVTSEERAELAAYQLKGVAQIWFKQWKELMGVMHFLHGMSSKWRSLIISFS